MLRYGTSVSLLGEVLPALLVFSVGLALTVAPLTATVLGDVRDSEAGIASAINNAIARTAGLISVAAVGAIVSAHYGTALADSLNGRLPPASAPALRAAARHTFTEIDPRAIPAGDRGLAREASAHASEGAFHLAMGIGSGLLVVAGVGGGIGLRSRRGTPPRAQPRSVACGECAGGQLSGAPAASVPQST